MLQVDLRELARGAVETRADLPANDPLFEGLDVVLTDPVRVAGRLQAAGVGRFYWHGSLGTRMAGQCRRCLAAVSVPVEATIDALFSHDPDALEDPSSYALAPKRPRSICARRSGRSCCSPFLGGSCVGKTAPGCARAAG